MGTGAKTTAEARIETWVRVMLGQTKTLQKQSDPAWRHAYGIAQGVGLVLKSNSWPSFPTPPNCSFVRLVSEDQGRRNDGAPAAIPDTEGDPFVPAPLEGPPVGQARGQEGNAEQLIGGYLNQARGMVRADAAWRHAYGIAQGFGALHKSALWPPYPLQAGSRFRQLVKEIGGVEPDLALGGPPAAAPGLPQVPQVPQAPQLPQAPELPKGMPAFRSMPTMLDPADFGGEDDQLSPGPAPVGPGPGTGSKAAFRAMPTMLEAEEEEAPAPRRPPAGQRKRPPTGRAARPAAQPHSDTRSAQRPGLREALKANPPPVQASASARVAAKSEDLERIGRFKIAGRLGKGAMGVVFKGVAANGDVVAIKVLHARYGKSKRVKARFVREAKAVQRIQHAGVVRFVESGEEAGIGQYFAMEYVDGDPMHEMLRKRRGKPFELHTAMDYSLQICHGMKAAHDAGVIHRDLKPENVLVSSQGQVKITDFSLARRDKDSMLLTRPGQVMGTPHFMAPEQARGEEVDARADLYSLGALMYVLLTGQFPFPNGTVAEVIQAHCENPRPDPAAVNGEVPEELSRIVMKLMAIDRSQRHQTVDALLEELVNSLGMAIGDDEDDDDEVLQDALPAGSKVGGHTIQRVLGAGGMGAVYLAKDSAGNDVALKVLPNQPGRAPQERLKDVARFLNEAKLAARVVSPNTYRILGHGVDDQGQAYIVTSFHDGISLRELAQRQGLLSPELIMKVARGILGALQDCHDAGLVHRDVTPANVMLTGDYREPKGGSIVLIDFGLAIPAERQEKKSRWNVEESDALFKHRVGANEPEPEIDEDALFLEDLPGGTPAYMAPEVLEDPSLVDGRADLYGLGATLYHAATGHPPYTGETMEQVLYQQKNQLPAPITQSNADFPDELSELILQLLAQQPSGRPRSPKLCLNKLQRIEEPGSVPTYKPAPGPSPSSSAAGGVVVAALPEPVDVDKTTPFLLGLGVGVVVGMFLVFGIYFMGLLPPL